MQHFHVPGVSVTEFDAGEVVRSRCFGTLEMGSRKDVTDGSMFHACSISKMIAALCVLRLAQEGLLDLDGEANAYLTSWKIPDNPFTGEKKITIANLLAHQAGFHDPEGSFEPYNCKGRLPNVIDILRGTTIYHPGEIAPRCRPETEFAYSDAGYCVLAQIAEDVTGETIPQIAQKRIFLPLGLTHTFFWANNQEIDLAHCAAGHDQAGEIVSGTRACYPNVEGAGLWSTPNELALIVLDIIKAYHGEGANVLNQTMARAMLTPHGCVNFMGLGVFLGDDDGAPYFFSQGWGVGMQCKLRAYHQGQSGVVVMTNSEPGMEQDRALVGEIIGDVCNDGMKKR